MCSRAWLSTQHNFENTYLTEAACTTMGKRMILGIRYTQWRWSCFCLDSADPFLGAKRNLETWLRGFFGYGLRNLWPRRLAAGGGSDQEATLHEHPVASTMCRATSFTRFDDDRILAWVVFPLFHAFESHWLHTTVLKHGGAPYFSGLDPQNSCPNKKMRAQLKQWL